MAGTYTDLADTEFGGLVHEQQWPRSFLWPLRRFLEIFVAYRLRSGEVTECQLNGMWQFSGPLQFSVILQIFSRTDLEKDELSLDV
jgi:hypothetical protein